VVNTYGWVKGLGATRALFLAYVCAYMCVCVSVLLANLPICDLAGLPLLMDLLRALSPHMIVQLNVAGAPGRNLQDISAALPGEDVCMAQ
jgi:hypothetical protein